MGNASLIPLAKQQPDQSWASVTEEAITTPDANRFGKGVLVLADIANRQTRNIREASRELIGILQSLGRRLQENKGGLEEIETWRQSLQFQATALNDRALELDEREDNVAELESRYKQYQEEMAAFADRQAEVDRMAQQLADEKQSIGRTRTELNERDQALAEQQAAVAELQNQLQQQLAEVQQSSLSAADAQRLQETLNAFWQTLDHHPTAMHSVIDTVQHQLDQRLSETAQQLEQLQGERQHLEQQQQEAEQVRNEWHQHYADWTQSRSAILDLQRQVHAAAGYAQSLEEQVKALGALSGPCDAISQSVWDLINGHDVLVAEAGAGAAPAVSPDQLAAEIANQRRNYEENTRLIQAQVSELDQHYTNIAALETKLASANDNDKFDIEMDLDYAREAAKLLQESLAPQQENAIKIEAALKQQEAMLAQLQGAGPAATTISLAPILGGLKALADQQQALSQNWLNQIQSLRETVSTKQAELDQRFADSDRQQQQLQTDFTAITDRLRGVAEAWGKVCSRLEELQANQHHYGTLRQQIDPLREAFNQGDTSKRQHLETLQSVVQAAIA